MAFKVTKGAAGAAESPEALFLDIRTRKVPGLLAHQADVLRQYVEQGVNCPDVALQLPTGSGKTLVGLLVAEWRRRKYGERCVYLCPTNQLVYQVAEQAREKYGLKVNAFVGKKADYAAEPKAEYLGGESIALTSYSGLFNTHPFFENPACIVLDDAHSAEGYISGLWTLRIERHREDHAPLFFALVNTLKNLITPLEYQRLTDKEELGDRLWVEKIPTPLLIPLIGEVAALIDVYARNLDLQWPWNMIRDHLEGCHCYVSQGEILIRPFIPPTFCHEPFARAKHRVYMSATLGDGGELERVSGRRSITRIKAPAGWDKQGVGRRLFFFPARSLNEEEAEKLSLAMITEAGRALVLVSDDRTANLFRAAVKRDLGFPTFDARAIEQSKTPFLQEMHAVAVVANRYDGIDFLDDQCRLIVVVGLPRATNIQERFVIARMGAVSLLNNRILTRIVQAFGRCTRSPTDYAAVVVLGEELFAYLLQSERRSFLHPELQAELQFGIEQAKGLTAEGNLENLRLFLKQGKEWEEADQNILKLRAAMAQVELPGAVDLSSSAAAEIEYQEALWARDYERALDACKVVLGKLNDHELRGYRALWGYFAGSAAWLADRGSGRYMQIAKQYFREAKAAAPTVLWLAALVARDEGAELPDKRDALTMCLIERFEQVLERQGVAHDRRFAAEELQVIEDLQESESIRFEAGQEKLGALLGFAAGKKESSGSPDPWWLVGDDLCIVFEDYSDAKPGGELNVNKARQVAGHGNWVRANLPVAKEATIIPVLVSPIATVSPDALPHLGDVVLWNIEHFREWARRALAIVRELRRTFPGSGDLAWRAEAAQKFHQGDIAPITLLALLNSFPKAKVFPRLT